MCKRTTADPLVRIFLDTYRVNLLAVPRADARVGDLYVRTGKTTSSPGFLGHLVGKSFELPTVAEGERLPTLGGLVSDAVAADAGLGLLDGFLAALGAGDLGVKAQASYRAERTRSVRFRLV